MVWFLILLLSLSLTRYSPSVSCAVKVTFYSMNSWRFESASHNTAFLQQVTWQRHIQQWNWCAPLASAHLWRRGGGQSRGRLEITVPAPGGDTACNFAFQWFITFPSFLAFCFLLERCHLSLSHRSCMSYALHHPQCMCKKLCLRLFIVEDSKLTSFRN